MRIRLAHLFALSLLAFGLSGCGGGGIAEGPPADNPGYVAPTEGAEDPGAATGAKKK